MGTIDELTDSKPPKLQPQGKGVKGCAVTTYAAATNYAAPTQYMAATGDVQTTVCCGDVITCNALISACAKDKRLESALHIFEAMQQQGVLPNQFTYNALMRACKEANQPELTLEVFRLVSDTVQKMPLQGTTSWAAPRTFSRSVTPTAAGAARATAYPAAKPVAPLVTKPSAHPVAKSVAHPAAKPAAHGADKTEAMFGKPSLSVPGLWHEYDIKLTADNTRKPVRVPTMEERIMTMKQVAWENPPTPRSAKAKPKKTGFCF